MLRRHALLVLLASAAGPRRTLASTLAQRALRLPGDFGAHPEQHIEWWYLTGHLSDAAAPASASPTDAAPQFGFQVTFFRTRTPVDAEHPSRFAASQLLFGHAALTDLRRRRLLHDQRIARKGFGLAEFDTDETRLTLRRWTLTRTGPVGKSRYIARIDAPTAGFGFKLQSESTQPVLPQGDAGWSRKGPEPDQASLYYSEPQLAVAGSVEIDGARHAVSGRAWLDHEWSDSLLDAHAVGWDWIGMNLDDGSALTAFQLRRADGSALYAGGSMRRPGANVQSFGSAEVKFAAGRVWISPHSATRYPVQWSVETPAGRYDVAARPGPSRRAGIPGDDRLRQRTQVVGLAAVAASMAGSNHLAR
jgi:predicted secreted hydrolase